MPPISEASLLAIWSRAAEAEIGIALTIHPPAERLKLQTRLYAARDRAKNPAHASLMLIAPPNGELWLVKKETELD